MWSLQTRIEKSFSYSVSYSYSNLKSPNSSLKCGVNSRAVFNRVNTVFTALDRPFHGFWYHFDWGANTAKITINVWQKLKVRCQIIGSGWCSEDFITCKWFLIIFQEHRFAVRRKIALYIFHTNISTFSNELHISLFGPIFIFCRIELIFGRLTCFDMKSIIP